MNFPTLLREKSPSVYAYSIYSVISEKFEAFVSLGYINSRYKDFYDIYILAINYDLDGNKLQQSIVETFDYRKTLFEDIVVFEEKFAYDPLRVSRWKAFVSKYSPPNSIPISFLEVIVLIQNLLIPIVNSIKDNQSFHKMWSKMKRRGYKEKGIHF